jgi:hypothetical protein
MLVANRDGSDLGAKPFHNIVNNRVDVEYSFRVPDRGSGNRTPLGGWDRGVEWLDGSVQAGGDTVWASLGQG